MNINIFFFEEYLLNIEIHISHTYIYNSALAYAVDLFYFSCIPNPPSRSAQTALPLEVFDLLNSIGIINYVLIWCFWKPHTLLLLFCLSFLSLAYAGHNEIVLITVTEPLHNIVHGTS